MKRSHTSRSGVSIAVGANGTVLGIEAQGVRIPLHRGSLLQSGGTNIYLRIRGDEIDAAPLLGPASDSRFINDDSSFVVAGEWKGLSYTCRLVLSPADTAWMWDVNVVNNGDTARELDLLYVQDIGLTGVGSGPNELYVSQYIDHHELHDGRHGLLLCSRQVQIVPGRSPWLMLGSTGCVSSLLTDGLDFYGPAYRQTGAPQALTQPTLAGLRQGETAIAALQEQPFTLQPGETTRRGFCALFRDDHPNRTTDADAAVFAPALDALEEAAASGASDLKATRTTLRVIPSEAEGSRPPSNPGDPSTPLRSAQDDQDLVEHAISPLQSCFSTTTRLQVDDLSPAELDEHFGTSRRNPEE